ncbi:hypothetical protein ACOSQ4_030765 [Xanthoceras sorbifolium]
MEKNNASKNKVSPNLIEKNKACKNVTASLHKLNLNPRVPREKAKPPSLLALCLGVVGKHLEDIIVDLGEIAVNFPADIKIAIAAIARRRKLLNDNVILSLADSSWEILDISGSDVSDSGLEILAKMCKSLRAVDISRCDKITATGVSELVQHCYSLETLRCGGSPRSDHTARRCLGILKPKLNDVEGDSWEELDTTEIGLGAQSLRWFVWPKIDKDSLEMLSTECPRIIVNPKPSPFGFRVSEVPREAFPDITLDDPFVKDVDPKSWAVSGFTPKLISPTLANPNQLPIAERFRLAYVERDTRLAPKRAKNARQHQRRAEKEWMMANTSAKAIALASKATKSLNTRKL